MQKIEFSFMKNSFPLLLLLLLSIALLATGCKKNYVPNEKQVILFQYDYINYARGYIHEGFYIDEEGNIMHYSNPENWNFHAQDYNLTESQIAENLSKCTKSDFKVAREDIVKFSSYIDNIASSKITALKNVASDSGTSVFICYTFNEQNGIYKGSVIRMEGNYTCENLNFYSKKISLWLKDINHNLKKK